MVRPEDSTTPYNWPRSNKALALRTSDGQFTGASCVVILPFAADGANLEIGITSR